MIDMSCQKYQKKSNDYEKSLEKLYDRVPLF